MTAEADRIVVGDVVDARQPYRPTNAAARQGVDTFVVSAPSGADNLRCWSRCESRVDGNPNAITEIADNEDGTYTLTLRQPISTGGVTVLTYTADDGAKQSGRFVSPNPQAFRRAQPAGVPRRPTRRRSAPTNPPAFRADQPAGVPGRSARRAERQ